MANRNPILDTCLYTIESLDGVEAEYSANVIAENMWAQFDIDSKQNQLMDAIIDHKPDGHTVQSADGNVIVNGQKHMNPMEGWFHKLGKTCQYQAV
jgi:hypothetical protein